MTDFKAGDSVICVEGTKNGVLTEGKEYYVKDVYSDEGLVVIFGSYTIWRASRFIKKEEQQMQTEQKAEQATKWIVPTKKEDWDNVLELEYEGEKAVWWLTRLDGVGNGVAIIQTGSFLYTTSYVVEGAYCPRIRIKVPIKKVRIPFDPKHPKLAEATLYYKSSVGSIKVAEYHVFADGHVAIRTEQTGMVSSSMCTFCPESHHILEMEIEE